MNLSKQIGSGRGRMARSLYRKLWDEHIVTEYGDGTTLLYIDRHVDTDIIFPARYLLLLDREGLGAYAFQDRRYRRDGSEDPDFVLNRPGLRDAGILIARENFGCGSSREHAVWTLRDRGIRCVIAPSFGEIFYANAFRNGLLPIVLPEADLQSLKRHAGSPLTIDLAAQTIDCADAGPLRFDVAPDRRNALLNGQDDVAAILGQDLPAITTYEAHRAASHPWLFRSSVAGVSGFDDVLRPTRATPIVDTAINAKSL